MKRSKENELRVKRKRRPFSVNCFTLSNLVKHFIVPLRLKRPLPWHLFLENTTPTPLSLHDSVDNSKVLEIAACMEQFLILAGYRALATWISVTIFLVDPYHQISFLIT